MLRNNSYTLVSSSHVTLPAFSDWATRRLLLGMVTAYLLCRFHVLFCIFVVLGMKPRSHTW